MALLLDSLNSYIIGLDIPSVLLASQAFEIALTIKVAERTTPKSQIKQLIKQATDLGILDDQLKEDAENLRKTRNLYAHYINWIYYYARRAKKGITLNLHHISPTLLDALKKKIDELGLAQSRPGLHPKIRSFEKQAKSDFAENIPDALLNLKIPRETDQYIKKRFSRSLEWTVEALLKNPNKLKDFWVKGKMDFLLAYDFKRMDALDSIYWSLNIIRHVLRSPTKRIAPKDSLHVT